MNNKNTVAVLGSGAWGTALASILHRNGYKVILWSAFADEAENLAKTRKNPLLHDYALPDDMIITAEREAVREACLAVLAVPSFALGEVAESFNAILPEDTVICNVAKGMNADGRPFSELVREKLPNRPFVMLSGPSLADEVAEGMPTAVVSASRDEWAAELVQNALRRFARLRKHRRARCSARRSC